MDIFFTAISIFYAFRSVQIAVIVGRNWANLRGQSFTPQSKSLASQASFFLAVPIGVFIHELGHAIFVVLFGGQVLEFGYRVFWGFVRPAGFFTAEQNWLIALAGTVGSLIFGVFIWLALKNNASPTFRFFGLRAFRYQIFFSLIYYPVFTLMGFYGDWRTIYDFTATPILSGATAVIHAGMLLLFWQADRGGFFEMGAFASSANQEQVTALEERAAANPYDSQLQLQLIDVYRQGGLKQKAKQRLQQFLKENPHSAEGHLQAALIESMDKAQVPSKAKESAIKAISLGLNKPTARAAAHQIIGRYELDRNNAEEAASQYSQAIGAIQSTDNPEMSINLLYYRGLAYRRKGQYEAAYQDVKQAIQLAQDKKLEESITFLENELETISRHAGRPLDTFTTPPTQF